MPRCDSTGVRIVASTLAVLALAAAAPAAARAPEGFVGTMLDGPVALFERDRLAHELDVMRASGVETVRVVWSWRDTQPYVSWEAVPEAERPRFRDVGSLPLSVGRLDALVELAARRGLRVFPVTVYTPVWNVRSIGVPGSPPRAMAPYAAFLRALVGRYGSRGTFWREHPELPRLPVRWWQLWNEPHLSGFWTAPRWWTGYASLLRAGARAVHRADPRAKVVMAGLTTDRLPLWERLDQLLAEGLGPEVDMVAAHVFSARPRNVIRALRRVRATLRAYGLGRTPIALTEWSWPSSRGRAPWETTPRGQARRVAETLRLLGRARSRLRVRTAIHYTWAGRERGSGWAPWAGLRRVETGGRVVSKPALAAFRRAARSLRR
jgi:hypothetical protein